MCIRDRYKIAVLGDGGVGKSAITIQFTSGIFATDYDPTIEDAYRIDVEVDGEVVGLDIIDTAGQEIFQAVRERYIKDGEGFLLVYSITEKSTLNTVKSIQALIEKVKDTGMPTPIILVGNKCDLEAHREISKGEGELLARSWQCPFFETSAKERINIDETFHELVRRMKRYQSATSQEKKKKKEKSKKCVVM